MFQLGLLCLAEPDKLQSRYWLYCISLSLGLNSNLLLLLTKDSANHVTTTIGSGANSTLLEVKKTVVTFNFGSVTVFWQLAHWWREPVCVMYDTPQGSILLNCVEKGAEGEGQPLETEGERLEGGGGVLWERGWIFDVASNITSILLFHPKNFWFLNES